MGGRPGAVAALLAVVALAAGGCGLPRDTEGTLEELRGGVLEAGVVASEPWAEVQGGRPQGIEIDAVRTFAAGLDADVVWVQDGETALMEDLHAGRLDVVVGGLTTSSPWASQVALTRPYVLIDRPAGGQDEHVMAVRAGENALLVALERHLAGLSAEVAARVGGRVP